MSAPPPKKKQKSGGSFCAMGGCSNRSSRDTSSSQPERDFLRYLPLPKDQAAREDWLKRMKRDLKSWNPSPSTRVCSDHFFQCDFREDDLGRYKKNVGTGIRTQIRLKPNSIPNTDRRTGRFADPLDQKQCRPPPKDRCPEAADDSEGEVLETSSSSNLLDPIVGNSSPSEETLSEVMLLFNSDSESSNTEDSDFEMGSDAESADDHEFVGLEAEPDFDELHVAEEPVIHESVATFSASASWVFVNVPLLLSLFKFCPECGVSAKITKIVTQGFAVIIHYKCYCYGITPHEGV